MYIPPARSVGHEVLPMSVCLSWFCFPFYPLANEVAKGYSNTTVRPSHPCEHSRINTLQWILTKLGTYLVLKRIWNPIDFQGQGHQVKFLPHNILVNTRINILQWILTKLGTYLVLMRVWNPIDFQGHRSKIKVTG